MRLLFEIDTKDYDKNGKAFIRPSARSIIIKDRKVAMVHSIKYDYYKFPGGGIENDEDRVEALIRETLEEAGLVIVRDSIKEYVIIGLLVCMIIVIQKIDMPSSLLPTDNIFNFKFYKEEFSAIYDSLKGLDYNMDL